MDPARMGRWAWDAARLVVGQYGGDANWIWNDFRKMDVGRFVGRLLEVPGIGSVKALVLAFLLHRDWGADIVGWRGFRPPMDAAMLVAAGRLGIGAPESDGDPESIVKVCEGLRKVSKLCAQERPQCGACPLSAGCPRQGV
jgi:hypothetical protein